MGYRRKAIPLSREYDHLLRHLYIEFRIPTDQYERRPQELGRFIQVWNDLSNRTDLSGEVLHYMVTHRKQKRYNWPTFGGKHKRLESMPESFLSKSEWMHLEVVYIEVIVAKGIGSDNLAYDEHLAAEIAREFFKRTGRNVSSQLLFAAILVKRKRGEWIKSRRKGDPGIGFGDINQVG